MEPSAGFRGRAPSQRDQGAKPVADIGFLGVTLGTRQELRGSGLTG